MSEINESVEVKTNSKPEKEKKHPLLLPLIIAGFASALGLTLCIVLPML